ncbi:MAG TPA: hypothetical protein VEY09_08125 [Pyrinomonadaceae bacterium]|nr:hypothetical protein [Pyrinomonadaceae bacterium]
MLTTNKILPVALVAALLGGTVGALVMRPGKTAETAQTAPLVKSSAADAGAQRSEVARLNSGDQLAEQALTSEGGDLSDDEKAAFRDGFLEGVRAARDSELTNKAAVAGAATAAAAPAGRRVVYRDSAPRTRAASSRQAPRRVYYDYGERKGRSFWQKHRDKLTVAIGTGAGAALGGAVGGKKGALIGGLAGAGGSALYTYKLRKKDRRY